MEVSNWNVGEACKGVYEQYSREVEDGIRMWLCRIIKRKRKKIDLPDRELNPGHPRDRRVYWPLYYRGSHDYSLQKPYRMHSFISSV